MALYAMWAHGHSIQAETPDKVVTDRRAWSIEFNSPRSGNPNWFHFAVPTSVIASDKRLRANTVLIRFRCGTGTIRSVHVYDGEKKIAGFDNLNMNFNEWHTETFWVPGTPLILWGVGISILVDFGLENRWIEFSSAGCDLI